MIKHKCLIKKLISNKHPVIPLEQHWNICNVGFQSSWNILCDLAFNIMFMAAIEVEVTAKNQSCSWKPPYHPRSHKVSHPCTDSSHFHKALIPYAHVLCDHVSAAETDREGGRGGEEYRRFMKRRWRKGQKWSWSVMMLAVTLDRFPFSSTHKEKTQTYQG